MKINKLFLCLPLLFSMSAQAGYQLDNTSSSLDFISIKKNTVGEINSFKQLSGGISSEGQAQITIALDSVETHIDIRNERMKTLLLETVTFPTAVVTATLDSAALKAMKAGDVVVISVDLALELHGQSKVIPTDLRIVGLNDGALLVSVVKPIMLYASDFGLDDGIVKLMEVAKLPSISSVVPVSFSLVFKPQ